LHFCGAILSLMGSWQVGVDVTRYVTLKRHVLNQSSTWG